MEKFEEFIQEYGFKEEDDMFERRKRFYPLIENQTMTIYQLMDYVDKLSEEINELKRKVGDAT